MKVTFIGTGSGKVSLERFHSSILVSKKNSNLLIDVGDSISRALLNLNISINSIDQILISHNHADHYSGIASLVTQMKLLERSKPLKIFTHQLLSDNLKL
ncbi:MAG: MBL fold metallo-hydrolase, partial [Melioribacteraceae bacterium]|nr:MBL fold metallo-hydrolase [Melioribacteraceae bacterium]